jgi:hypothetical protein
MINNVKGNNGTNIQNKIYNTSLCLSIEYMLKHINTINAIMCPVVISFVLMPKQRNP